MLTSILTVKYQTSALLYLPRYRLVNTARPRFHILSQKPQFELLKSGNEVNGGHIGGHAYITAATNYKYIVEGTHCSHLSPRKGRFGIFSD